MLGSLLLCIFLVKVESHGYLFEPPSRTRQAHEAGRDYCPHCSLKSGMTSEAPEAAGRNWPGGQAFADPGTASSVTQSENGVNLFGVCGTQKLGANDYNIPDANSDWGTVFTDVKAGDVLDVSWAVNADHGGVYQWRLCDKPELVAKLWGDVAPTAEEYEELEACYQDGILRCDDVPGNDCGFEVDCQDGWGCAVEGLYFHCGDGVSTYGCSFHSDGTPASGGVQVQRKVLIPRNFPTGPTVMSWRWDSHETVEVFAGCADINITPADNSPTNSPVFAPTAKPTTEAERTDDAEEDDDEEEVGPGYCCWWGPNEPDRCNPCESIASPDNWCAPTQERCEGCGGVWCQGGDNEEQDPEPTPEPTPKPTPEPTPNRDGYDGEGGLGNYCCFLGSCLSECYAPVFDTYHCGQSANACTMDCNGEWCSSA